ncbi:chemotaxis protein CheB [Pedobacter yulinensis]|uniref:protein-glutamate methylesterase n=1 Tax=Pedobacter yulinensis TaxID=2126353 RepID=A0A2T3HRQ9_9SPHI|nr:chemotaxis protein CheB [Pedobacter yulinensis]PST85144.1 chemotaxis protein CheB [Pedobacter yulinensis]
MNCEALFIGGSAGSLDVLLKVFPGLRADISFPIVIIVHRKRGTDSLLSDLLASRTTLRVKEAEEKEALENGWVYIAPADYHLLVEQTRTLSLDYSEKVNYSRPSIDVSFQTAADVYRDKLICILLSGSNADGVEGLQAVKAQDGRAFVQHPDTAQVPYMPAQGAERVAIDGQLTPEEMAQFINGLNT